MSERVTMPALGESVTEGTINSWLKSVGDTVEVDEPLLEISTDKVDTEVPSPFAGTLIEILVDEDETVEVGAELCVIGDEGEAPAAAEESEAPAAETTPAAPEAAAPEEAPQQQSEAAPEPAPSGGGGEVTGGNRVTMPALGESVTEGTVNSWLKSVGDTVEVDEPLLEISTDKVDTEVPSPFAGTLTKILAAEDETVEVGGDLCIIGGEAAASAEEAPQQEAPRREAAQPEAKKSEAPAAETTPAAPEAAAPEEAPGRDEPPASEESTTPKATPAGSQDSDSDDAASYVTPLVRKLASEHGVDLSTLTGTGIGGRIRKQDVLDAAKTAEEPEAPAEAPAQQAPAQQAPAAAPAAGGAAAKVEPSPKRGTREPMTRLRKVIAERMVESLQVSAQLTAAVEVDMTRVAALRAANKDAFNKREGVKLTYLPFIALATIEALKQHPQLNCQVEGTDIVYPDGEHLGIAVDTERGLLVPVIKDAGDLNIAGIAKKINDLAARTRANKVTPDELGGGTFTITNIGSAGSIIDTPIINQPQVAILGTGVIVKRPAVVADELGNDSIAIRSQMMLVLTYDHRVVDGADAGRFLTALKKRLEGGAFDV